MPQLALRDVLSHEFVGVSESDELLDAVELMRSENTSSAVVLRGSTPVGVITAESVFDLLLDDGDPHDVTAADVMDETPESLSLDASVADAADLMGRTGDPRVLVADDNGVHGIVEARDVAPSVEKRVRGAPSAPSGPPSSSQGEGNETYAEQGVCEGCGSLAHQLVDVNGQLLCPECRAV
ncbi:CBS domain-containing protein [Halobacterium bonnevillei]|jgi:CBS domain-containing protein|uniref:CBS domain-containing protein n=1 Tax=Halobacterium bonnevillei TaxID=2692200 RepID=A0A6B0SIG3_9EURY|nr:CBS domain-containing protein [Halobacterium bonnevillei]MXR21475.1 CBS domain-containing protein [Halobacterium bonnevillei]